MSYNKGFGLIEVVIATFVIGVVAVGIASLITLTLKSSHDGQRRIIATALANEKMEMVRNLPYSSVGMVDGVPSGPIVSTEVVSRNGADYTVRTDIRYIDDPFDGTAGGNPEDALNTDYKQIRVDVSWNSTVNNRPVLLITQVAPKGIEGGESLGTLIFQALNAAGGGVANASVHLVNSSVNPAIDLTTSTNNDGKVVIPGLPISSGSYNLTVTKAGYTSEQTYSATSTFTPNTDHSHLTSIASAITNKTFSIDQVSSLTIQTSNAVTSDPIANVAYSLTGTKQIGTNSEGNPVYVFDVDDTTDGGGSHAYQDLVWDTYTFATDGVSTGYDIEETSILLPLALLPAADETMIVKLAPHTPLSLHATVISSVGSVISGATVQVTKTGYDETKLTSAAGQSFFADMPDNAEYTVTVSAPSYEQSTQQVLVDGTVRITMSLTPV